MNWKIFSLYKTLLKKHYENTNFIFSISFLCHKTSIHKNFLEELVKDLKNNNNLYMINKSEFKLNYNGYKYIQNEIRIIKRDIMTLITLIVSIINLILFLTS